MDTLLAEDLILLLLDDETGKQRAKTFSDALLGGALLAELAATGQLELHKSTSRWQSGDTVAPAPNARPADPILQGALAIIANKPQPAGSLVGPIGKGVSDSLLARLAERGILHRQDDKVLGLFSRTRWPANDSRHEVQVRQDISRALVGGEVPQPRTAALIALLHSANELSVLDNGGMSAKEVKARAGQIAEGDWAGGAVGKAVQDVTNAIMVGIVTSTIITTTTTST
ncbi:GOLPH3/VPS74 family protein [Demetria terragena]|uniref:GOLPH3/VPS74 family protein n=1 Tax=Demetria terragena TaxID=63959 RepID=UPI000364C6FC|nr:GPP34 family phosphoprotein [Demetria terragena]